MNKYGIFNLIYKYTITVWIKSYNFFRINKSRL